MVLTILRHGTMFGMVFIAISASMLFGPLSGSSGSGGDRNSTIACSLGFFVNNVTEIGGTLAVVCSQVGWTQLTGFPSGCSAGQFVVAVGATLTCSTPSGDSTSSTQCSTTGQTIYNITESSSGVLTSLCRAPDWTKLINFPSGCTSGQFVTGVGVTLTCSSVAWTQITSFPSGCSAGQFVTAVGATLTCAADSDSSGGQSGANNTGLTPAIKSSGFVSVTSFTAALSRTSGTITEGLGDLILIIVVDPDCNGVLSVTDTKSSIYSQWGPNFVTSGGWCVQWWQGRAARGTSMTVTVTIGQLDAAWTFGWMVIGASVTSGRANPGPVIGQSRTCAASPCAYSIKIQTSNFQNTLLLCYGEWGTFGSATYTPGGSQTNQISGTASSQPPFFVDSLPASTIGVYTCSGSTTLGNTVPINFGILELDGMVS